MRATKQMFRRMTVFQTGSDQPLTAADRRARVLAIKRAVAAGTYRCNDRALADRLLTDLLWEQWQRRRLAKTRAA
jgi:anti-sigma28 factor (negative regulator of flagellin synthesis)